ncbi:unnamed protein product [Brassica oleracea var. botrytis]
MKTGEYWRRNKVFLKVVATFLPPKYCVDHNVWYEDYLQREGLLIEEFAAVEGLDETPEVPLEPAIPKRRSLWAVSLPKLNQEISSISSKMLEEFLMFDL